MDSLTEWWMQQEHVYRRRTKKNNAMIPGGKPR